MNSRIEPCRKFSIPDTVRNSFRSTKNSFERDKTKLIQLDDFFVKANTYLINT